MAPSPRPRVFCLALFVLATLTHGQPSDGVPDPASPVLGSLPNGLRYIVVPHASPTQDLALRLVVDAGSLDEADDERGFAHFVEHMAFSGSRHAPPGALRYFFQQLGLPIGSHLNAQTSYTQTVYQLNLTAERIDRFDDSLTVLRDYADGLLFLPEEVQREAGVVLSELRSRDNVDARTGHEIMAALFAGTKLTDRSPIGVAEQIEAATPEQLRSYYNRNYTPSRMTVVVVGNIEAAIARQKIEAAFGSMTTPPNAVAPTPAPAPLEADEMRANIIRSPVTTGVQFLLGATTARPADTVEGRRQELTQRIAMRILDLRLRQRAEAASQIGNASANYTPVPFGSLNDSRIIINAAPDAWADAIELAEMELRRARQIGFTKAEVDEAIAHQLASWRTAASDFANLPASRIASDVVRALSTGRSWRPISATLAENTATLQDLTAESVIAALTELLPEDQLHAILVVPENHRVTPERLLAAYERSTTRSLRRRADAGEELAFAYSDFGSAGKVVQQSRVEDLDLTLVTFANGVRLNVRPTSFEPERFRLRIVFPNNYTNVHRDRGGQIDLAGHLFSHSAFRRHKSSEMARLLALHGVRLQFAVNYGTPALTVTGPSEELSFALQWITALLSDLQLHDDTYRTALSRYAGQHRRTQTHLIPKAVHDALHAYTGKDTRVMLHHPSHFATAAARGETEKWMREHFLNGPIEIGLVGDLEVDEVVSTAEATVGTLSRRRGAAKPNKPLTPVGKAQRLEAKSEITDNASGSCVIWPVDVPDDPRQQAALTLAVDAFNDRLFLALRDILGAAYSARARLHRDMMQRDFAFVSLTSTYEPSRAIPLTEGTIRLAARTAETGLRAEEFARVLEPARTRCQEQLRSNAWWLESVSVAQSRPDALRFLKQHPTILDEITIEEVNSVITRVFKNDRVTVVIVHSSATNPAAPK